MFGKKRVIGSVPKSRIIAVSNTGFKKRYFDRKLDRGRIWRVLAKD
jgi:hypothetical protein